MALETHRWGVAGRARAETPSWAQTVGGRPLEDVAEIVGLVHDFGKATTWFQQHLDDERPDGPKHHARLGALTAYYVLDALGYCRETRLAGLLAVDRHHGTLPSVVDFIKRRVEAERARPIALDHPTTAPTDAHTTREAAWQAANIDYHRPAFAAAAVDELCDGVGDWSDLQAAIQSGELLDRILADISEERAFRGQTIVKSRLSERIYVDALRLYGTLTFTDKTHAAGIDADDKRLTGERPDRSKLVQKLDAFETSDDPTVSAALDRVRTEVQEVVGRGKTDLDRVDELIASDRQVASLALPTGYGKTLTGLLAALSIRDRVERADRIVYALPFTTIIDQTAKVISDTFDISPTRNAFTIHHHLAETMTLDDINSDAAERDQPDDREASRAAMLAESWRTGLTLTTFVQLFESLAGPRNGQSMKLPALYDSVIVIDEPQSLPQYWWPLVRRLVNILTERFGAYVILMTATQPSIVDETFELVCQARLEGIERQEFEGDVPSRVTYQFDETALEPSPDCVLTHEDGVETVVEGVVGDDESALVICNTIDSTEQFTEALQADSVAETVALSELYTRFLIAEVSDRDQNDGFVGGFDATDDGEPSQIRARFVRHVVRELDDEIATLHLTTRVRPCDRAFLLAVANDLARLQISFVLVSTQLVEAGVDVSFDQVYRDFGPLDSIVQAAGRCNRSFERAPKQGHTRVWQLESPPDTDSDSLPSRAVYARGRKKGETDSLGATRRALRPFVDDERTVSDTVLARDCVDSYHDEVGEAVHSVSSELVNNLEECDGDALRQASIIERRRSYEVYVCRIKAEETAVREVARLIDSGEYREASNRRTELAGIRVSVPVDTDEDDALAVLESVSGDEEDPERILPTQGKSNHRAFDDQLGVIADAGVGDRFF